MRFGLLQLFDNSSGGAEPVSARLRSLAAAEKLGFDAAWVAEQHFQTERGHQTSPAVTLAALSQLTRRIRLGVASLILPFHHPLRAAEDFALVDRLSGGRLDLGVGRGYLASEFRNFAVDPADSRGLFDESLKILLQAWTRGRVRHEGRHFRFPNVPVAPLPLQKPHPPIWRSAVSRESFTAAGKAGHNLLVFGFAGNTLARSVETYRGALRAARRDLKRAEVGVLCMVYVAPTTEQARRDFAAPALAQCRRFGRIVSPPPGERPVPSFEEYPWFRLLIERTQWDGLAASDGVICGDPKHCVRRIERLRESVGCTQLICWTSLAGLDPAKARRSLELLSRRVLPRLRRK